MGFNEAGEVVIAYHIRAKCVPKEHRGKLSIDDFKAMYDNQERKKFEGTRFARAFKDPDDAAIQVVSVKKEINKSVWNGRVLDRDTNIWLPIFEAQSELKEENTEEEADTLEEND